MKTCFYVQAWLMIITGICSILLLKISPYGFYALYLALCFLSGYFSTFVNVPLTAQFQLMVDEEYQTRFFSILSFSSNLMIPLGTLFAGLMSDLLRSDVAYLFNGFLMILVLILVFRKLISEKVNQPLYKAKHILLVFSIRYIIYSPFRFRATLRYLIR